MQVKAFNGLNNVGDPLNLGLSWLVRADNIHILHKYTEPVVVNISVRAWAGMIRADAHAPQPGAAFLPHR